MTSVVLEIILVVGCCRVAFSFLSFFVAVCFIFIFCIEIEVLDLVGLVMVLLLLGGSKLK